MIGRRVHSQPHKDMPSRASKTPHFPRHPRHGADARRHRKLMRNVVHLLVLLLSACVPALGSEPVRIGRHHQLFLDDHLIERTEHLMRRVQPMRKHEANPLIVPRFPWEPKGYVVPSVLYDAEEKLFKAWLDGYGVGVFYFTSKDGIHWERPLMRLFPEFDREPTNRVILSGSEIDVKEAPPEKLDYMRSREPGWRYFGHASGVIKDLRETDPARRYKMAFLWINRQFQPPGSEKKGKLVAMGVAFSPDGIHWTPVNEPVSHATVDLPFHISFDEKRGRWVLYGRAVGVVSDEKKAAHAGDPNLQYNNGRSVIRCESGDFIHWTPEKGELVLTSDARDSALTEIYDMRSVPYGGLHIGFVHMFHNDPTGVTLPIQLGVSRDNRTWHRLSDRTPILPVGGVGDFDRGVISPPTSDPIAVGDELRFYYTGRNLRHSTRWKFDDEPKLMGGIAPFHGAFALATIQRDRFVAMEAGYRPGILRTKPFIHEGTVLHLNAAVKFGVLKVSLLGHDGQPIQQVTLQERDSPDIALPELSKLAGRKGAPVQLEFSVQNGRLFSFWVE